VSDPFDDLCARYRDRLVAVLIVFGRPEQDAQDLAHDVLLEARKHLDRIGPGMEWAYLRTAALNRARNQATRRPAGAPLDDWPAHDPSPEAQLIAKQERERFFAAVSAVFQQWPQQTRLAFAMRLHGDDFETIARRLGMTSVAVRSRVSRAMQLLRASVAPPDGVDDLELPGENDHDHKQ
jgi:RNA polymerase sigma factor (sigma-70 family)